MKRHLHSSLTMLVCFTLFATMLTGCKKDAEEPEPEPTTGSEMPEPEPEPEVEPVAEPCVLETFPRDLQQQTLLASAVAVAWNGVIRPFNVGLSPTPDFRCCSPAPAIRAVPKSTISRSESDGRNRFAAT